MRKPILTIVIFAVAGIVPIENTQAQQTPAAKTAPAPPSSAQKTPAAKTGQAAKPRTQPVLTLKTQKDKVSYALGANLGMNLHALAGGKLLLTDEEARAALTQLQTDLRTKQMDVNKKAGADFLEANKAKEGVVALPSGLQYKILTEGTGPKPSPTDTVSCNYRGTLLNGTEFDSSYKRGQPASFPVNGVIKGWTEALQLMPVGSKWQLFIPSDLAYGDRGADPRSGIGPGATLIFDVELLSIQDKAKSQVAPK